MIKIFITWPFVSASGHNRVYTAWAWCSGWCAHGGLGHTLTRRNCCNISVGAWWMRDTPRTGRVPRIEQTRKWREQASTVWSLLLAACCYRVKFSALTAHAFRWQRCYNDAGNTYTERQACFATARLPQKKLALVNREGAAVQTTGCISSNNRYTTCAIIFQLRHPDTTKQSAGTGRQNSPSEHLRTEAKVKTWHAIISLHLTRFCACPISVRPQQSNTTSDAWQPKTKWAQLVWKTPAFGCKKTGLPI